MFNIMLHFWSGINIRWTKHSFEPLTHRTSLCYLFYLVLQYLLLTNAICLLFFCSFVCRFFLLIFSTLSLALCSVLWPNWRMDHKLLLLARAFYHNSSAPLLANVVALHITDSIVSSTVLSIVSSIVFQRHWQYYIKNCIKYCISTSLTVLYKVLYQVLYLHITDSIVSSTVWSFGTAIK